MSDIIYLSPMDLGSFLKEVLPTHEPIWIHGAPGVGKTSIVQQTAEDLGLACPPFPPAVTLESCDVRGVPYLERNGHVATAWAPPTFWPHDPQWKGVIFVDELPQAPKEVQSAFLQLTYGGKLGDYKVPEGATFVVAGNRQEDRAGTSRVITPLLNRFIHVGLELSTEHWQEWARSHGIDPVVRAFLNFRPALLSTFDPTTHQVAFATPRSWEKVSKVFQTKLVPHLMHAAIAGAVGGGPAAEFLAFSSLYGKLPDLDKLLANPHSGTIPTDPAVLYALSGALGEKMRKADAKLIAGFVQYVERMPTEYAVLGMRDAICNNPRVIQHASQWMRKHGDTLRGVKS